MRGEEERVARILSSSESPSSLMDGRSSAAAFRSPRSLETETTTRVRDTRRAPRDRTIKTRTDNARIVEPPAATDDRRCAKRNEPKRREVAAPRHDRVVSLCVRGTLDSAGWLAGWTSIAVVTYAARGEQTLRRARSRARALNASWRPMVFQRHSPRLLLRVAPCDQRAERDAPRSFGRTCSYDNPRLHFPLCRSPRKKGAAVRACSDARPD